MNWFYQENLSIIYDYICRCISKSTPSHVYLKIFEKKKGVIVCKFHLLNWDEIIEFMNHSITEIYYLYLFLSLFFLSMFILIKMFWCLKNDRLLL